MRHRLAVGFDISPVGQALAPHVAGDTGLYTVDLVSGAAELVGLIGAGTTDMIDVTFVAASGRRVAVHRGRSAPSARHP